MYASLSVFVQHSTLSGVDLFNYHKTKPCKIIDDSCFRITCFRTTLPVLAGNTTLPRRKVIYSWNGTLALVWSNSLVIEQDYLTKIHTSLLNKTELVGHPVLCEWELNLSTEVCLKSLEHSQRAGVVLHGRNTTIYEGKAENNGETEMDL